MPFELKEQHDYDLHVALEVGTESQPPMLHRGRALGIRTRGLSDHGTIDLIYFRDPNGYVVKPCAKRANHDALLDPATQRRTRQVAALGGGQVGRCRLTRHHRREAPTGLIVLSRHDFVIERLLNCTVERRQSSARLVR